MLGASRNKTEAYRVYGEYLFRRSDNADARIFLKGVTFGCASTPAHPNRCWRRVVVRGLAAAELRTLPVQAAEQPVCLHSAGRGRGE